MELRRQIRAMKNLILTIPLMLAVLVGCKKEENEPTTNGGGGGGATAYGYVSGPEGSSFDVTTPGGDTETIGGESVMGWDGGQLLNYNFWKQIRITANGETFFLRYNMLEGTDWEAEVEQEHDLYNYPFLLQYSQDMTGTIVELYCPSSNQFIGNASGTVELELDVNTVLGMYDGVGHISASFTNYGQTTTLEGDFWVEVLD